MFLLDTKMEYGNNINIESSDALIEPEYEEVSNLETSQVTVSKNLV